jgi:hypothetical protein
MYAEEVGAEGERGEEKCVGDTVLRSGGRMYWQGQRMSILAGMPKGGFAMRQGSKCMWRVSIRMVMKGQRVMRKEKRDGMEGKVTSWVGGCERRRGARR